MKSFFEIINEPGRICAHRGARSLAPENTLFALEKGRSCGADLWETDVQMTADGELVLLHDATLLRTSDISQRPQFDKCKPWKLAELTWSEVSELNAGDWFLQSDPYGTLAAGEISTVDQAEISRQKIPRLRDALDFCREFHYPMNLEIKAQPGTIAEKTIVETILQLLLQTGTRPLILLSSFQHQYLVQAKKLDPGVATAALVDRRHPRQLLNYLSELQVDAYHPDQRITSSSQVRDWVDAGLRVNLWTVNEISLARDFKAAGAGFICTDWPQRLQNI